MFIITRKCGQLGNRLFLFAQFIAFAIENNEKIVNLAFVEYVDLFENTRKDILCRYPAKKSFIGKDLLRKFLYKTAVFISRRLINKKIKFKNLRIITAHPCRDTIEEFRLDDPGFLSSIKKGQITFVQGFYFCDYINLLKHADRIKKYFTLSVSYEAKVANLINKVKKSCDLLVGVHIRRGDYKNYLGGKFYYEIDDYISVMQKTEKLHSDKRVGFLVCSNEPQDKNKFSKFTVAFGTNHIIEDMYSLASCDYIFGPPSSYSRWAGFYGDAKIYMIEDLNEDISLENFILFEEIVHRHMKHAPQFPRS
jgi:Glycosyl transferase family 11